MGGGVPSADDSVEFFKRPDHPSIQVRGGPQMEARRFQMMRKTSLILVGAAASVAATLVATQPQLLLDFEQASAADTYGQLILFGDVFERVRAEYVEKPDDGRLIESAISGMLAGLDPHSSYMDSERFRDM